MNARLPQEPEGLDRAVIRAIQAERGARGMSVEHLAKASGVPYRTLTRYLSGERSMPLRVLGQVAAGLRLTPDTLVVRAWTERREQ